MFTIILRRIKVQILKYRLILHTIVNAESIFIQLLNIISTNFKYKSMLSKRYQLEQNIYTNQIIIDLKLKLKLNQNLY